MDTGQCRLPLRNIQPSYSLGAPTQLFPQVHLPFLWLSLTSRLGNSKKQWAKSEVMKVMEHAEINCMLRFRATGKGGAWIHNSQPSQPHQLCQLKLGYLCFYESFKSPSNANKNTCVTFQPRTEHVLKVKSPSWSKQWLYTHAMFRQTVACLIPVQAWLWATLYVENWRYGNSIWDWCQLIIPDALTSPFCDIKCAILYLTLRNNLIYFFALQCLNWLFCKWYSCFFIQCDSIYACEKEYIRCPNYSTFFRTINKAL